jgi:glutamate synthase (NADPH/NADH) small chain
MPSSSGSRRTPRCICSTSAKLICRGQSLVVWAIREGRQAAHAVDKFLMGATDLPR